jgi:DNA-binding XRE family transcriptional regulator
MLTWLCPSISWTTFGCTPGEADELRAWVAEAATADRLRFIREIRGMTQRDAAGEFGISQSEVSKLENGHHLPLATPHLVYAKFLREADPTAA